MYVPGRRHDRPNRTEELLSVPGLEDVQCEASDIEFEHVCEPCTDDGHRFEAYGFCSDCNNYLCETCYNVHRRPIPMRNHKLLDKDQMPKTQPQQIIENTEIIEEQCHIHAGRVVEFYCGNHDIIGCSVCITINHKSCDKVQFVPDIEIDSNEVGAVINQLSVLGSKEKANQVRTKQRVVLIKDRFDNAIKEAEQFSKNAKHVMERLGKDFKTTTMIECERVIENEEAIIDTSQKTVLAAESLTEELTDYKSRKKLANMFIAMKKAKKCIENISNVGTLDGSECSAMDQVFIPDKELENLLQKLECLGKIAPLSAQRSEESSASKKVVLENVYSPFRGYDKEDNSKCIIVAIICTSEPVRNIIADGGNNKIKVIKGYSSTLTTSLQLSSKPFSMANVSDSKVCVTIPEEKKILVITISKLFRKDTIKITKTIAYGMKCYAITSDGENMIVVCEQDDGRFAINCITTGGLTLRHFKCNDDSEPMCIAVLGDYIYALERKHDLIKCMSNQDGSVKNSRRVENVKYLTLTCNYLILVVVVGLRQVVRVFDHSFQEIQTNGTFPTHEKDCVCVNTSYIDDFYVGYSDGYVQEFTIRE